jgi:hypothetical protein
MDTPKDLRARAYKARRFAEIMIRDPVTVERLNQMADELEKRADAIEKGGAEIAKARTARFAC